MLQGLISRFGACVYFVTSPVFLAPMMKVCSGSIITSAPAHATLQALLRTHVGVSMALENT